MQVESSLVMLNFAVERVLLAAQCVAIATLTYRESVSYARERKAFKRSPDQPPT